MANLGSTKRSMYMKKIKVLGLLLLLSLSSQLFSQKFTEFTPDSIKYIKELDEYFQYAAVDKDAAKKFIEDFGKFFKRPDFTPEFKEIVYATSNKMLAKKYKPVPYFQDYLTAVSNFIDSKRSKTDFDNWQLCIDKMMKAKAVKAYAEFLDMSLNLFDANEFYKTPSYECRIIGGTYKFDYDSLPRLTISDFDLSVRNNYNDSIMVFGTKGTYYPSSQTFYGKGGKVTWERTGLDAGVFAQLKNFKLICKTGGYTADSAQFSHPKYFDKPQLGVLTEKVANEGAGKISYPRFDTYTKRVVVKNVIKDVDFEGGFAMRGPKFIGSGDSKNLASLVFKRNNERFLTVSSRAFYMAADRLSSDNASVKFNFGKDSLIHPNLSFKYIAEERKVDLIRGDDGVFKTPFYSSFHKLDMYFENLTWKIDSTKIELGFLAGNKQGEAFFESVDFFTQARLEEIRGNDGVNPLNKINEYYMKNDSNRVISVVDLAKYLKWTAIDLRPILIKIATYGMVIFNGEEDNIIVKDKLFKFIQASKKKTDFDIITFHSVTPYKNGTINLLNNNFNLLLKGVNQILLSDTQQVFVFPKRGEVIVKQGRSFEFSGVVSAGKFEFHGKDFFYDYDKNKVDLKNVDSLRIFVNATEPELDGEYKTKLVQTVIENINGELVVDHFKNHGGRMKAPSYPIFKSFKESYAYYDKRSIQRGAYGKDKFYFKLDPYTIDSLDNFTNEQLFFGGEFVSAGIFPTFRDTLRLQKDYSLGFIRKTPPGGFQVYGGKAKFENEIRLSNKGLRADGDINFGPSVTHSSDFIFYPDSMNGIAETFDVKEQTDPNEFPQAHGDNVRIHWMPYKDLMQAFDLKTPFTSYNTKAILRGRYDLSPTELYGAGKVDFEKADLISRKILFKKDQFFSDTADFHLQALDGDGLTLATDNVNSHIDFTKRVGTFISNGKASFVRFPKNEYICRMDRFKWFMDNENIQLGDEQKKIDAEAMSALDLEGPEFISVQPKQDSLRFFAPAAQYNLRSNIIKCINVPFINVADARIFPDSGKVTIFKKAVIDTIRNSVILANTVTKYHTIKNVKANIYGRKQYLASGDYTYLDEDNNPYLIHFNKIQADTTGQTLSEGEITEKENFKFNDHFSFAGKVYLIATLQNLSYEGGTKIVHNCKLGKSYLQFAGEVDPKNIFIPIPKNPLDVNGKKIGNGIVFSPDTNMVYSAFLSPKGTRIDKDVLVADGVLTYDKESKEYRISTQEKLVERSLPGNYLSLNTENCIVEGEGILDLGADFGQLKSVIAGKATHVTVNDSAYFNLMMTFDWFFENSATKKMAADVEVYVNNLTPVDFSNENFTTGLKELLGKEKSDKVISDLNLYGQIKKMPDELEKLFWFTNVDMIYDKKSKSFISTGKLGLGNINKTEINKYVNGKIQIKKQKAGDELNIYIELDQNTWYYFKYFKGVLKAVSSNQEFNNAIKDLKAKKRKQDVDKGPNFQFIYGNPKEKDTWLKKLKLVSGETD